MGTYLGQQEVTQDDIEILQEKFVRLLNWNRLTQFQLVLRFAKDAILLFTGPNTGGKTICLKAVGVVVMMAKAGLYVLCSEPARIPWFDTIFADIGDEQQLTQSLSTFSGHLRQISQ